MPISEDDVRHVARLARLELAAGDVPAVTEQLNGVLDRIERLQAVDVAGVEPLAHIADLHTVWRPDEPRPGVPHKAGLSNAASTHDGYFRVPRVVAHEEDAP